MDRATLLSLLTGSSDAYKACRAALQNRASFDISDGSMPASHFAEIYRGREIHTRDTGIPTLGFAEAVEALFALHEQPLGVGRVRQVDPPYSFFLFLTADASAIVACIGVDQQHQAQRAHRAALDRFRGD